MKIAPGQAVRLLRTGADGKQRVAFIGYIGEIVDEGDQLHLKVHAPEKLITDRLEPRFPPPFSDYVTMPQVFDFWWKQLDYVFGLADPRSFPPLPTPLSAGEHAIIRRYVRVAAELAESGVLNGLGEGFNVRWPYGVTGPEEIETRFSRKDLQVGFAGLLRQCDSPKERAHFERVRGIIWAAVNTAQDDRHDERIKQLRAWSYAAKALHKKSLNQLVREKLAEEGWRVFEYDEEHSPMQLLSFYNYGELLHWDRDRDVLGEFERDKYVESDRRLAYLEAGGALGHLYVGFGELARHAIGEAA
jgi:hypothetical protein